MPIAEAKDKSWRYVVVSHDPRTNTAIRHQFYDDLGKAKDHKAALLRLFGDIEVGVQQVPMSMSDQWQRDPYDPKYAPFVKCFMVLMERRRLKV